MTRNAAGDDSAELAELARSYFNLTRDVFGRDEYEEVARGALQRLIDDPSVRKSHPAAFRLIEAALGVDMTISSNRKGELPRAMGFASRRSKGTLCMHLAVITMMEHILESDRREAISPSRAAVLTVRAFFDAGINTRLSTDNVQQIWSRHFGSALRPR